MAEEVAEEVGKNHIPRGLWPYFQEYDPQALDLSNDANLILQRALKFGTWEEVRWLFRTYGKKRIGTFIIQRGKRVLSPVTFHY